MGTNLLALLGVEFIKALPAIIKAISAFRKRNREIDKRAKKNLKKNLKKK